MGTVFCAFRILLRGCNQAMSEFIKHEVSTNPILGYDGRAKQKINLVKVSPHHRKRCILRCTLFRILFSARTGCD